MVLEVHIVVTRLETGTDVTEEASWSAGNFLFLAVLSGYYRCFHFIKYVCVCIYIYIYIYGNVPISLVQTNDMGISLCNLHFNTEFSFTEA